MFHNNKLNFFPVNFITSFMPHNVELSCLIYLITRQSWEHGTETGHLSINILVVLVETGNRWEKNRMLHLVPAVPHHYWLLEGKEGGQIADPLNRFFGIGVRWGSSVVDSSSWRGVLGITIYGERWSISCWIGKVQRWFIKDSTPKPKLINTTGDFARRYQCCIWESENVPRLLYKVSTSSRENR